MKTTSDSLGRLLDTLADTLATAIKETACPSATLNVARQLLRDNGVQCDADNPPASIDGLRKGVAALDDSLPSFTDLPN